MVTEQEASRLLSLQRRALYLEQRIAGSPRHLSYDQAELAALQWAIAFIRGALDHETNPPARPRS